ncbi:hypothetical protein H5410_028159, partial [Solanum commersonii]
VIPSTRFLHIVIDGRTEDYMNRIMSPFYSENFFEDAYAITIESLPCESSWDIQRYVSEFKLLSLDFNKKVGRPQLECWKGFAYVKFKRSKVTCSTCRRE